MKRLRSLLEPQQGPWEACWRPEWFRTSPTTREHHNFSGKSNPRSRACLSTTGLPGTDTLLARLLLQQEASPEHLAVLDDVRVAWRNAGVDC